MLNAKGERELAYIVKIDNIVPIEGADRVEQAIVGGWRVMVRKNQFKPGDYAVYFEIDSKVPEQEPFMFLAAKNFKIKTQKYFKGTVLSQGLLMGLEDFIIEGEPTPAWVTSIKNRISQEKEVLHEGLTEVIGVTYAVDEDNKRKSASVDKYKVMAQRRPKLFRKPIVRWFMRREWGRRLMFFFFGKKKDKKTGWPAWVVKTDEERVQNMPWLFSGNDELWIATEKIDGTSTTFTMRGHGRKREFYICSRNVVFDKPDKKCYYETNVYTEMAEKYNIEHVLSQLMNMNMNVFGKEITMPTFVTIQGETYGEGIQKRDYGLKEHCFKAFNVIFGLPDGRTCRLNPKAMRVVLEPLNVPCVDIVYPEYKIPETIEELLKDAGGSSTIDGGMREGLVFRSMDGVKSFKAVDNEFLMKYHNG